jgi:hypothetical protein
MLPAAAEGADAGVHGAARLTDAEAGPCIGATVLRAHAARRRRSSPCGFDLPVGFAAGKERGGGLWRQESREGMVSARRSRYMASGGMDLSSVKDGGYK